MSDIEVAIEQSLDHVINGEIVRGSSGTDDYNDLTNKPSINGVELVGNKTTADLGIDIDTSNLALKSEVPTKTSQLENDSGFITDISESLQGGKYVDIYKPSAETLYEYKSVFDETNIGMVTANNVTCFTNQFDYMINEMSETTQLEQPISEMYGFKLKEEQINHIVPLLKADKTPYTLLECINDSLFTANGITDLTRENKVTMLNAMTGGNVDPDTSVYAIQMKTESPFFSSCLLSVYQDKSDQYIIGVIVGWHVTPVSETQVGEAGDYFIVDLKNETAEKINKNTTDIQALNTKVDNLPTGGAEYTAGSGISISGDNVISSTMNIQVIGNYDSSTTYKRGEIVRYSPNTETGWQVFMNVIDNNLSNKPNPRDSYSGWIPFDSTFKTLEKSADVVPICTINSEGNSAGRPNNWVVKVPSSVARLENMPKIDLSTGLLIAPAGIEGYYTKAEVDALIAEVKALITDKDNTGGVDNEYEIVGTLNGENNVLSGFSGKNYISFNKSFEVRDKNWEVVAKFTTTDSFPNLQGIYHFHNDFSGDGRYGLIIRMQGNKFNFVVSSGYSWLFNSMGSYTLLPNTTYWVKASFNGTRYVLSYSVDGKDYIEDIVYNSTSTLLSGLDIMVAGVWYDGSSYIEPLLGTLDLNECYMKIGDNVLWG